MEDQVKQEETQEEEDQEELSTMVPISISE